MPTRLREVRSDRFGENGIPALAEAINIPARTWENFEGGVQIPGWILLRVIVICGVEPHWLMTGEGERYRTRTDGSLRQSIS